MLPGLIASTDGHMLAGSSCESVSCSAHHSSDGLRKSFWGSGRKAEDGANFGRGEMDKAALEKRAAAERKAAEKKAAADKKAEMKAAKKAAGNKRLPTSPMDTPGGPQGPGTESLPPRRPKKR
eukprot:1157879-Pelagomonas_calceolata.AAC.4